MLETIYEVDEDGIDDDLSNFTNQPSRLSYYICWCMIIGCFLTLILIIAISLNPSLLSKTPINKTSRNISVNLDDKLTLSTNIIKHLDIFFHQINEQLNLQPNTITFFTSNFELKNENQSEILWIYSHLKYPQSCVDNNQCKEHFHPKLITSFTKLSDFLKTIKLNYYYDKQIQLDWCSLIQNSTRAILVSSVSIKTINQNETESFRNVDRSICDNIDQNILLSKTLDKIIQHDFNNDSIENEEEINLTCNNPTDCTKYNNNNQRTETTDCLNDIQTQILLIWNSFSYSLKHHSYLVFHSVNKLFS